MMKRKLYIYAAFALAVLAGCRKSSAPDVSGLPEDGEEMTISVKSGDDEPKFTFLFWMKEDFDRGLLTEGGADATPYHIANPTGEIGSYEEIIPGDNSTDYNTGRAYPENYGIVTCTGYAPYSGVSPAQTGGSKDYQTLNVTAGGYTDVMVSQNAIEGSAIYPFHGNLEFFHPQIKLTVKAKLAPEMAKYIKDVSFSIGKENLISSLTWSVEDKCYLPSDERNASTWTSEVLAQQINSTDEKTISTAYVIPAPTDSDRKMTKMDLIISGSIANTIDGDYAAFSMTAPASFKDLNGNDLYLKLNDSYEILLLFDEDQIEITAVKIPWEEGGNILVPIHPIPDENE
jgi:hypothetical protein